MDTEGNCGWIISGGGEQRLCWPPFNIRIYAIESSVFTHIRSLAFDTSQIDLKHAAQRERQRDRERILYMNLLYPLCLF